jgi:hypothetical protein
LDCGFGCHFGRGGDVTGVHDGHSVCPDHFRGAWAVMIDVKRCEMEIENGGRQHD